MASARGGSTAGHVPVANNTDPIIRHTIGRLLYQITSQDSTVRGKGDYRLYHLF